MTRICYDAVTTSNAPGDGTFYAYYTNGTYANESAVKRAHPGKRYVVITVTASAPAQKGWVLDCETGDATPSQAVTWVHNYPGPNNEVTVYCNSSTWPTVRAAFRNAGVGEPSYWIAEYDGDPTIPSGAIAKQYLGDYHGYDKSSVAAYWPGVDASPTPVPPKPPVVQEDTEMIIVHASGQSAQYLLFSTGKTHHIVDPASLASYVAAGLKTAVISAADLAALLSAK